MVHLTKKTLKIISFYILGLLILTSCDCYQVVEGTVVDRETKQPLKDVKVFNKKKNWSKIKTDSLGHFELSNVSGGFRCPSMEIVIEHSEYETEETKIDAGGFLEINLTKKQNIPQGIFIYELYFAEFDGRMANSKCEVTIDGNKITVEQIETTNLTGGKEIFRGLILKHQSGKWILADQEDEVNADEIGGCTGIPIIEFDKKIIKWC